MLILGWLNENLVALGLTILAGIYHVAAWSFELFLILACGELLSTDKYQVLIENFYVVIGIVMLFFLAFVLLKSMADPDNKKGGTSTVQKVIVNLVVSTLILAVLPMIFTFLYDFQDSVIMNQNTIGKFFGYGYVGDNEDSDNPNKNLEKVRSGAYQIVNSVFTAFLNIDPSECNPPINDNETTTELISQCQQNTYAKKWKTAKNYVVEGCETNKLSFKCATGIADKYGKFMIYANFADNIDDGEMSHNFLLELIAGCLLAYIGISFAIDMSLRLVKLAFYQLIAPIPIFAMVIPDTKLSKSFNTWLKVVLTCYLEVYVRIFIMYFTIFLCTKMLEEPSFLTVGVYRFGGAFLAFFARAFALMGVILFMKQAPKLISEVTGLDSGNMKLGLKDKLKDAGVFTAGAAIGAGVTGLARKGVSEIGNVKNKWSSVKGTTGKAKAKAILGAAGTTIGSIGKAVAATNSAAVRATKAGWKAGSFKDAAAAAGKGAHDSISAGEKRAAYKAAHSQGKGWLNDKAQVIKGYAIDTLTSAKGWAGIKNLVELKEENAAMEAITSSRDAFDSAIDSLIQKEMSKGKTKLNTGLRDVDFTKIRTALDNLNTARVQGYYEDNGQKIKLSEAETIYNNTLKNARFEIQDDLLISDDKWDKLDADVRAKLASSRVKAITYKGNIRNNASLSALAESGIIGGDFSDDKDYILSRLVTDDFTYSNNKYTNIKYNPSTGNFSWTDGNGGSYSRVLNSVNDQGLINMIKQYTHYDDNATIDMMNKSIKRHVGDNQVEIARRDQQKPDEKKK